MSTSLVFRKGQGLPSEKCFLLQRSHDLGGVDYETIAVIGVGHAFAAQAGGAPITWLYPEEPPEVARPGKLKVSLRDQITREDPPWELRLERGGESTLLAYLNETKLASLTAGLRGYHTGILPSQAEIETLSRKMTAFRIEDLRAEADRLEANLMRDEQTPAP